MDETILLAHGGGALLTESLIKELILSRFENPILDAMEDSAVLPPPPPKHQLAFTTDSYVVSPAFFPGGCIGDLAVCGTVNDLAMSGATPKYLSMGLILEEGLAVSELEAILDAAKQRAEEAGVQLVCGDTKVVPKGLADKIYINTAGVGWLDESFSVQTTSIQPGDQILVSGALGLHGLAVMLARGNLSLQTPVQSDVAPLNHIVDELRSAGLQIRAMRDLTRGGLTMALHGLAHGSNTTLELDERLLPTHPAQDAACELLGLDPLHVACEGRFVLVVAEADASAALAILQKHDAAKDAALTGSVKAQGRYPVEVITPIGSSRVLTPPRGEQMPRIC